MILLMLNAQLNITNSLLAEAAIKGVPASVDTFKLLSGGWCLEIERVIVFENI